MATAVEERTGTAAVLAILAALGGILLAISGNPGWALLVHFGALFLGAIGVVMAASPRVAGGILSLAAIVLSVFGIGLDLIVLLGALVL